MVNHMEKRRRRTEEDGKTDRKKESRQIGSCLVGVGAETSKLVCLYFFMRKEER